LELFISLYIFYYVMGTETVIPLALTSQLRKLLFYVWSEL